MTDIYRYISISDRKISIFDICDIVHAYCSSNSPSFQIRAGGTGLKHVTEADRARPAPSSRDDLLSEIRSGVTLKKVEPETEAHSQQQQGPSGIAGMLQLALKERSGALRFSSSEDEDDEEDQDDDEWDD